MNIHYVTYAADGTLTGGFFQTLHPSHEAAHIKVNADQLATWVTFKANATRDGLEPADISLVPTVPQYTAALERMYDATAAERRYDNRLTCALRAGYPGPFQSEGLAFAIWMDTCNAQAYIIMGEVLGGQRATPTIPELLALMPPMVWP